MIAILGALEQEIGDIKKDMSLIKVSSYKNRSIYSGQYAGQKCILALTGIGKNRAEETARFISMNYSLNALMSVGFGGALNERTGVGDVVVYSSLICPDQKEELFCDAALLAATNNEPGNSNIHIFRGKGVTVPEVCSIPDDKKRIGEEFLADVTDMESYWIGKVARENGLPFLAVRTIFDTVGDDLSFLEQLTTEGDITLSRAFSYLISHPGQLPRISACSHKASLARKNIAIFVKRLIKVMDSRQVWMGN